MPIGQPTEIVLRLDQSGGIGPFIPTVTVYADGRLLRYDVQTGRLTVQVLSGAGIDALVGEMVATGSFDASHEVRLELLPGVEAPGIEVSLDRFRLRTEHGLVDVTNVPRADARWFAPSAERDLLAALAERLLSPDWLAADAWIESSPSLYRPPAYLLFSGFTAFPPTDPICPPGSGPTCEPDVDRIAWPVSLPPDGFGPPFSSADGSQSTIDHCAVLSPEFAAALVAAARPDLVGGLHADLVVGASVPWRARNGFYEMAFRGLLPEETATCVGKSLPPVIGP